MGYVAAGIINANIMPMSAGRVCIIGILAVRNIITAPAVIASSSTIIIII